MKLKWSQSQCRAAVVLVLIAVVTLLTVTLNSSSKLIYSLEEGVAVSTCRSEMKATLLPDLPAGPDDMLAALFNYLTSPHPNTCQKLVRQGGVTYIWGGRLVMDGHKYVCFDLENRLLDDSPCLVYSFGIQEDWSFEWAMELLDCAVFAFDPSINDTYYSQGGAIRFYRVGIGVDDSVTKEGWRIFSLESLVRLLNHTNRTIDYIKMDVEDAEWDFLYNSASNSSSVLMTRVRQIGVELHLYDHMPLHEHLDFFTRVYRTFLLLQQNGFYLASHEANLIANYWTDLKDVEKRIPLATEVVWIKSECYKHSLH